MRRSVSMKALVLVLAITLILGCAVGGTIAWLMTQSQTITNTFTATNIEITLTEQKTDFPLVPGKVVDKDPLVTVTDKTTVDCWLFVQIEETAEAEELLVWQIADGWTQATTTDGAAIDGIYYREVKTTDAVKSFPVLKDDQVVISTELTLDAMPKADEVQMSITAYAVQREGINTVVAALDQLTLN